MPRRQCKARKKNRSIRDSQNFQHAQWICILEFLHVREKLRFAQVSKTARTFLAAPSSCRLFDSYSSFSCRNIDELLSIFSRCPFRWVARISIHEPVQPPIPLRLAALARTHVDQLFLRGNKQVTSVIIEAFRSVGAYNTFNSKEQKIKNNVKIALLSLTKLQSLTLFRIPPLPTDFQVSVKKLTMNRSMTNWNAFKQLQSLCISVDSWDCSRGDYEPTDWNNLLCDDRPFANLRELCIGQDMNFPFHLCCDTLVRLQLSAESAQVPPENVRFPHLTALDCHMTPGCLQFIARLRLTRLRLTRLGLRTPDAPMLERGAIDSQAESLQSLTLSYWNDMVDLNAVARQVSTLRQLEKLVIAAAMVRTWLGTTESVAQIAKIRCVRFAAGFDSDLSCLLHFLQDTQVRFQEFSISGPVGYGFWYEADDRTRELFIPRCETFHYKGSHWSPVADRFHFETPPNTIHVTSKVIPAKWIMQLPPVHLHLDKVNFGRRRLLESCPSWRFQSVTLGPSVIYRVLPNVPCPLFINAQRDFV